MTNAIVLEGEKKVGVVYLARNLINGKVYVGITSRRLSSRISEHTYDSHITNNHSATYFHRAIHKYGLNNFMFTILENVKCSDAKELKYKLFELEKKHISIYNSNQKELGYNLTNGGDGISGYKLTQDHKLKVSKAHKGKRLSDEQKERIRRYMNSDKNPNIGRVVSDATKAKISASNNGRFSGINNPMYGKKRPDVSDRNMESSKKVCQFDLETGKLLKIWNSIREIQRQTGYNKSCVTDCCKHKAKQSHGYKWEFYITAQKNQGEQGIQ